MRKRFLVPAVVIAVLVISMAVGAVRIGKPKLEEKPKAPATLEDVIANQKRILDELQTIKEDLEGLKADVGFIRSKTH